MQDANRKSQVLRVGGRARLSKRPFGTRVFFTNFFSFSFSPSLPPILLDIDIDRGRAGGLKVSFGFLTARFFFFGLFFA